MVARNLAWIGIKHTTVNAHTCTVCRPRRVYCSLSFVIVRSVYVSGRFFLFSYRPRCNPDLASLPGSKEFGSSSTSRAFQGHRLVSKYVVSLIVLCVCKLRLCLTCLWRALMVYFCTGVPTTFAASEPTSPASNGQAILCSCGFGTCLRCASNQRRRQEMPVTTLAASSYCSTVPDKDIDL